MNVRASNYPARWNAAPSQELLVIRRNHHNPFPSEAMRMWAISTRVNKPENDDASIWSRSLEVEQGQDNWEKCKSE
jgi:putative SOS response-associated peptidase YedK